MIQVTDLVKSFGGQAVLDRLSLTIAEGEKVILLGQNGAGKTTLMRCLLGEYKPDSGTVTIGGVSPFTDRLNAIKGISFVPQLPPPLKLTVAELIDYASGLSGFDKIKVTEFCASMQLDLYPHIKKPFYKLSGGMKQKVMISVALARGVARLIFDEPTANLDQSGRDSFLTLVREYCSDKTIIFISHRVEDVADIVTRKVTMDLGRITEDETV